MELFIALLPALVMVGLVIISRKVLLSLSIGLLLAAGIHEDFSRETFTYLWDSFYGIITSTDWYLPIIGFVILIGGVTSVVALSGGIKAFADWAVTKVKTPIAAKLVTWMLGLLIFFDDYFNVLVVGEVSKPITDRYKVSRAKLSYIIDSTTAPVVILMPLSTWGAYIVGIIGGLFADVNYTSHSGLSGFVAAVPYQFYPITAILMVLLVVIFGLNIGPMKAFEQSSLEGNDLSRSKTDDINDDVIMSSKGTKWALMLPVLSLLFVTLFLMLHAASYQLRDFMDQEITVPLFFGGLVALFVALFFAFKDGEIKSKFVVKATAVGMFNMAKSAIAILVLAWMVSGTIQDLGVGRLVALYVTETALTASILPFLMFIIAAFIAFSTGTSWGAFGILLPIAIPISMATDPVFMPVMIAAVLGGAVVGDHASPVSDTTVLSATGAKSTLHAHFVSQLPYVLSSASIAALAYLVFGLTEWIALAYLVILVSLGLFVYVTKRK